MQEFEPGQLGKMLIIAGAVLIGVGLSVFGLSKLGLFRLPGDIEFGGKNWRIFFPIASCIVISAVLTLILWMIHTFRK